MKPTTYLGSLRICFLTVFGWGAVLIAYPGTLSANPATSPPSPAAGASSASASSLVTLNSPLRIPIVVSGREVGSMSVPKGGTVQVLQVRGDTALVRTSAGQQASVNLRSLGFWLTERVPIGTKVISADNAGNRLSVSASGDSVAFFARRGLGYAERSKNGWSIEPVDLIAEGSAIDWPDAAVGRSASGEPTIFYTMWIGERTFLKLASRQDGKWRLQLVEENSVPFMSLSGMDSGTSVVYRLGGYRIHQATWDGTHPPAVTELRTPSRPNEPVERPGLGMNPSFAAGRDPQILFDGGIVATLSGGNWKSVVAAPTPAIEDNLFQRSFAVDSLGRASFLRYQSADHTIQFVHQDAANPPQWITESLDASLFGIERPQPGEAGKPLQPHWTPGPLKVGSNGTLHWLYSQGKDSFLAELTNGQWQVTRFPNQDFTHLAVAADGSITLYALSDDALVVARRAAAATSAPIPNAPKVVMNSAALLPAPQGRVSTKPYLNPEGSETERAKQLAAMGGVETIPLTILGKEVAFKRWGKGDKAIVFFNHSGPMRDTVASGIVAYASLIKAGYSVFAWEYPEVDPFNRVVQTIPAFFKSKNFTPLDLSGVACEVISELRAKCAVRSAILVGNSLGGGLLLWDYPKLAADPNLKFVLISPTEPFSPPPGTLTPLKNGILVANEDRDQFVKAEEFQRWIAANKDKRTSIPPGHLILGDNLSNQAVAELIQKISGHP